MNEQSNRFQVPAIAAALILSGCTNMSDPSGQQHHFNTQQSAADARMQIGQWIKPGASLADAVARMRSEGFECQEIQPLSSEYAHSVDCATQVVPDNAPLDRRIVAPLEPVNWSVILNSRDGHVLTDVQVSRSPKDIGG